MGRERAPSSFDIAQERRVIHYQERVFVRHEPEAHDVTQRNVAEVATINEGNVTKALARGGGGNDRVAAVTHYELVPSSKGITRFYV